MEKLSDIADRVFAPSSPQNAAQLLWRFEELGRYLVEKEYFAPHQLDLLFDSHKDLMNLAIKFPIDRSNQAVAKEIVWLVHQPTHEGNRVFDVEMMVSSLATLHPTCSSHKLTVNQLAENIMTEIAEFSKRFPNRERFLGDVRSFFHEKDSQGLAEHLGINLDA